jgi:membrane-bound lytic murein transglycosylase D
VLASTRAALDYLQKLYGMFGDWHLALAAYNWGEGNVGKAIARNQRNGLGGGYTDLSMPMETRFYVPKLQAIKNLVARPGQYNLSLPNIPNHPYFQSVPLPRDMDVAVAAKLAAISLDDFKSLNPSANRPVLLAAGTPHILLPWDNAETFQQNYEAFSGGQLASWTAWVAPSTLKVADAARRAGISEDELRRVNNIPPRMLIKAGSALLVPRSARMDEDVNPELADNGRLDLTPEAVQRRIVVKAGKKDTLASLARQYKVTEAQIVEWNDLRPQAKLQAGQAVTLMVNSAPASAHKGNKTRSAKKSTQLAKSSPAQSQHTPRAAADTRVAKR